MDKVIALPFKGVPFKVVPPPLPPMELFARFHDVHPRKNKTNALAF
jgi:hypothetical protein